MTPESVRVSLPTWCREFARPARFKAAYGGRGSGKSWAVARMILVKAVSSPIRVLCARELQVSIRDSVHRLLCDQIALLGFGDHFETGEGFIRSKAGAEFVFKGLRHNASEIKSTEGLSLAWIEEAQTVSAASWELLTPTVRAPGSEIWATFNPVHASDPTYQRFIVTPSPDTIACRVNWRDNPHFPVELEGERQWMARTDPEAYAHIWEGECRTASTAQVLRGKVAIDAFEPGTDWHGPYYGADWGFAVDPSTLLRVWIHDAKLYVEHEAYGVGVELDHLPALFERVPGSRDHTIRADSARPETISHMVRQNFRVVAAQKGPGSVEHGISHLRSFGQIVIHPRCLHTIEESRLWSYKVDRLSGDVLPDLVDAHNHCWDAIRYALEPVARGVGAAVMVASAGRRNGMPSEFLNGVMSGRRGW